MEESVRQSQCEQPLRPDCSTACVWLPCLASVSSHQCMASQVIHIMTPFCAIGHEKLLPGNISYRL